MSRILLITGLWVPFIGRAPADGEALVKKLAKQYPRANLTWHSWFGHIDLAPLVNESPLILIGHSFGGAVAVKLASDLERRGKRIDELLLLDPVPTDFKGRWRQSKIDVPSNVNTTRCIARSLRFYPRSKKAKGENVKNETRWIGHDKFMCKDEIVGIVEGIVKRFG